MYGWLTLDPSHGKRAYAHAECGLCAHYGASFRTRTRWLAAADPTLLVLTLEALADEVPKTRVRCPLTFKLTKRAALAPTWEPLAAVAELQLVLAGEKLYDDQLDKDGWLTKTASALLSADIERAAKALVERGFPLERLRATLRRQAALEADPRASLEGLATPTSDALGLIAEWLATLVGRPEAEVTMRRFGETLGRLLYMVDALHDLERDRAKAKFNPLDHALGHLSPRALATLGDRLERLVAHHRDAFGALPLQRHVATLEGSLVSGLARRAFEGLERVRALPRPLLTT